MKIQAMKQLAKNQLAMKQILLFIATLSVAPFAQADFQWSNLWQTPDQRGDALLHQGKSAEAAQTYTDARHKAYAELKAGHYAKAAHDLAPFNDSDALYNRGNALAHTGDLEGAIKAYDAALTRNPKNIDAQHNRDLVAQALKKQQEKNTQQQKKPSSKSDSKNQGNQGNQGKSMQNSPANGQGQNQQNTDQDKQSNTAQQKQNGSNQPNGSTSANQKEQNQSPNGNPNSNAQDSKPTSENLSSANSSTKTQTPHERATAAQHDAEVGLNPTQEKAKNNQGQALKNQTSLNTTSAKSANDTTQNTAKTESKMAEQQWLKNIPDNPEGLLQRKFLIEHLMRQQAQKTQP